MPDSTGKVYLPRPLVAKRYCVTERSIARWEGDGDLRFPAPMKVNGRKFFLLADLENWEKSRVSPSAHREARAA